MTRGSKKCASSSRKWPKWLMWLSVWASMTMEFQFGTYVSLGLFWSQHLLRLASQFLPVNSSHCSDSVIVVKETREAREGSKRQTSVSWLHSLSTEGGGRSTMCWCVYIPTVLESPVINASIFHTMRLEIILPGQPSSILRYKSQCSKVSRFWDSGRRHKTSGSEIEDFMTHGHTNSPCPPSPMEAMVRKAQVDGCYAHSGSLSHLRKLKLKPPIFKEEY